MNRRGVETREYLRALLVLGRVSNLPTLWSNCIAGWLVGGGGRWGHLLLVLLGGTFFYVGGMFLNDAYDADFDRQHRSERPVARGLIEVEEVWQWGLGWLGAGMIPFLILGGTSAVLAALLLVAILAYDAVHKMVAWSPVLMALCRCLLLLTAASAGAEGVTGLAVWGGLALGGYVVGLSYLARRESVGGSWQLWPLALLLLPCGLAWLVNVGEYRQRAWFAMAIFVVWLWQCLRVSLFRPEPRIGQTVSGLLAGIALVDLLLVGPAAAGAGLVFLVLFLAALTFQRYIPAT